MGKYWRVKRDSGSAVMMADAGRPRKIRAKEPKVRVNHEALASYLRTHCKQFPSVERAEAARLRRPLPSRHCNCESCFGKAQSWPVGYVWKVAGPHYGMSYECGLHAQTDEFLAALPHSSSIAIYASEAFNAGPNHLARMDASRDNDPD